MLKRNWSSTLELKLVTMSASMVHKPASRFKSAFLAFVLLTSSAYVAEDENRWCTPRGMGEPAELFFSTSGTMTLKIGKKSEEFERGTSLGTGLNGVGYTSTRTGKLEIMLYAEIGMDANQNPPEVAKVYIFRNQVFWPNQIYEHCNGP